ncbi:hypothetical protein BASA61_005730 [Batrachochytrium salamandrivorans]|nr:hypothetical protein BASA61_005730 [Batrachochytrium salamandrivorans]
MLLSISLISITVFNAVANAQYGDDDPDSQYTQPAKQYGQLNISRPAASAGFSGSASSAALQALQPQQSLQPGLQGWQQPFQPGSGQWQQNGALSSRIINNSHRILRLLALLTSVVESLMTTA